ncbi:MAG: phosphotransferase [Cyanobacteria bacterium P01_A01_bin.17]
MNQQPPLHQSLCEVTGLLDWLVHALSTKFGSIQQIETVKQRPWSQVYRIRAERGIVYFKICGMGRQHEAKLLQWLQPKYAGIIPEVVALDAEKGWIVMTDGGSPLRELPQSKDYGDLSSAGLSSQERLHQHTATLLSNYAELQQHSLAQTDTLLKMHLPDQRLHLLSALVQNLLLTGISENWFTQTLANQVIDTLPIIEQICQDLSDTAYSAALEHGDLHTGNILVKAGQLRICDWGDAWLTHPFCSLFPLLQDSFSPAGVLTFEPNTKKLINAYLNAWTPFAPIETLRTQFIKALYIGIVLRALNIANALVLADEPAIRRWSPYIAKYLTQWVQWSPQIG